MFESHTTSEVLNRYFQGPKTGIFTDGSSQPNPGPGGWGAVYVEDDKIIDQKYGYEEQTTNNRMELMALIEGYNMAPAGKKLDIYTDSQLCVNTITKWASSWKKRGWRRKTGPIKNLELVKELYQLHLDKPELNIRWVRGHEGLRYNEYADSLATAWTRPEL